jgi:hypothetical protein
VYFTFIEEGDPGYQMRESLFGGTETVLYKSKRLKFLPLSRTEDINHLKSVLSDAIGGGGQWTASVVLNFGEDQPD